MTVTYIYLVTVLSLPAINTLTGVPGRLIHACSIVFAWNGRCLPWAFISIDTTLSTCPTSGYKNKDVEIKADFRWVVSCLSMTDNFSDVMVFLQTYRAHSRSRLAESRHSRHIPPHTDRHSGSQQSPSADPYTESPEGRTEKVKDTEVSACVPISWDYLPLKRVG